MQYYKVDPSFLSLNSDAIRVLVGDILMAVYRIP